MDISVCLAPHRHTPEQAGLAERLGYRRIWVWDSPLLVQDVWVHLALIARSTERVGIGPGVLVPSLRHVVTTAAAIATLADQAPGRVAVGIGSGFSARLMLGQRPVPWVDVAAYIRALRGLLAGGSVEWEGRDVRLMHSPALDASFPVTVPIVVGADGPRGRAVAAELGDGIFTASPASACGGFSWSVCLVSGTVLDDGESAGSDRVVEAAGPAAAVAYHALYEGVNRRNPPIDALPRGADWRAGVMALPEATRHLAVHEEHLISVNERDRPFITADVIRRTTFTGTAAELRGRLEKLGAKGVTEVAYLPAGPDIARELVAFAEMAGLRS
jgi:5,10-methylenetetrahydromethanopterin reductase